MTKNRFLSKRVACLLTTALIASPLLFLTNSDFATALTQTATTITLMDNTAAGTTPPTGYLANGTSAVTLSAATATLTMGTGNATIASLTNSATNTFAITAGVLTSSGDVTAAADKPLTITLSGTGGLTVAGSVVATAPVTINLGTKTLTMSGDVNKANAAIIEGAGVILVTGTAKTFSNTIGATTAATTITVSAEKISIFNESVRATGVISHAGTARGLTFAKDVTAGSIRVVDGSTFFVGLSLNANVLPSFILEYAC